MSLDKCPNCNEELEREFIDTSSVPDGDGCANYSEDIIRHCLNCEKSFEESAGWNKDGDIYLEEIEYCYEEKCLDCGQKQSQGACYYCKMD